MDEVLNETQSTETIDYTEKIDLILENLEKVEDFETPLLEKMDELKTQNESLLDKNNDLLVELRTINENITEMDIKGLYDYSEKLDVISKVLIDLTSYFKLSLLLGVAGLLIYIVFKFVISPFTR